MTQKAGEILLVAADMDGTLLDAGGGIPDRTLRLIGTLPGLGVRFCVCTGRFPENASMVLKDHGLDCPLIALNGGVVLDAPFGRILSSRPMDPADAQKTFDILESLGCAYFMFGEKTVVTRDAQDRHHSEVRFGDRMALEAGVRYARGLCACRAALKSTLFKFYVYCRQGAGELARAREALAHLTGVELTSSGESNLEVVPSGVDKGRGLSELAATLGIPMARTMAIGDQENDLPMIRAAGLGVAMGNASAAVRSAADAVTLSNTREGVAAAIEAYVLSGAGQG